MKKTVSILLVFSISLSVHFSSNAQKKSDSLLKKLALACTAHQAAAGDTTNANITILLSEELVKEGDYVRGEAYAAKAILAADSLLPNTVFDLLTKTIKARAFVALAKVSSGKNNYNQAIEFCRRSLLVCADADKEHPNNSTIKRIKGSAYNTIGANYYFLSTLDKGMEAYMKALKIFEELGDGKKTIGVSNNIGLIHQQKGDSKKALEYYRNALSTSEKEGDKRNIAASSNNIGSVYLSDGDAREDDKEYAEECYNKALPFFMKALKYNKETGNENWQAFNYSNIGHIFEKKNNSDSALSYYQHALKIQESLDEKRGIAFSHQNIGGVFLKQGKIALAKEQYLTSLNMAIELQTKEQIMAAYLALSSCENKLGNFKKAYEYHLGYATVRDHILNEKSNRLIAEMQTRFETEKKDKENAALRQKNVLQQLLTKHEADTRKIQLVSSIAIMIVLIMGSVFVYNRRRVKQEALLAAELSKQEKLRFVAIIDAEEKERVRIAKELHDSLGQMLSVARLNVASLSGIVPADDEIVLNNSIKIIDDACDEVRAISHNMMPAALIRLGLIAAIEEIAAEINFSGRMAVAFTTNIGTRFSESTEITVYRIIQEVLNNIIKHSDAKEIAIALLQKNETIELKISENGKGFDTTNITLSKGLGWSNIYSRTAMLNGQIKVNSSQGAGTTIDIVFPSATGV